MTGKCDIVKGRCVIVVWRRRVDSMYGMRISMMVDDYPVCVSYKCMQNLQLNLSKNFHLCNNGAFK